jgi:A/G-specific adenine glycosylase
VPIEASEARFRATVIERFTNQPRPFPWRDTNDPYAVLIGEVLLQRTRGENVVPVYAQVMRRWPTPERLSRARVSTIASVIRPLGLEKRASTLKRLGAAIADLGGVPPGPDDLERLPGIGPYAAHAVPVFAGGQDLPVVDWVIARVLRRYFGMPNAKRPNADRELWTLAGRLARRGRSRELWLGTLDFAAAVCRPRPRCEECPLARLGCVYADDQGVPEAARTG